jgi:hypothetical protein
MPQTDVSGGSLSPVPGLKTEWISRMDGYAEMDLVACPDVCRELMTAATPLGCDLQLEGDHECSIKSDGEELRVVFNARLLPKDKPATWPDYGAICLTIDTADGVAELDQFTSPEVLQGDGRGRAPAALETNPRAQRPVAWRRCRPPERRVPDRR